MRLQNLKYNNYSGSYDRANIQLSHVMWLVAWKLFDLRSKDEDRKKLVDIKESIETNAIKVK